MGDLDLTESAARALLARMRRDGHLVSRRHGASADYRLAGTMAAGFALIKRGGAVESPQWTGEFHALLYQVPERARAYRDALRRAALLAGYGLLQQGVLIALTDRSTQLTAMLDPPPGVQLYPATITMTPEDAARAAREAWDLAALSALYAHHADTLEAAIRAAPPRPPSDAQTLKTFNRMLGTVLIDTLRAPPLPQPLRPVDWALPRLHAAIGAVQRVYGPPAVSYVRQLLM